MLEFGVMFFAGRVESDNSDTYRLLFEAAKFADQNGFSSIWTPERHFNEFGGLFSNPSLTSAALAMATENIELRAGSLIGPLHHALRIAEEWSFVDNISGGRTAISFGSGWNINDFVCFPERYDERTELLHSQIETIRKLWRGNSVAFTNSAGKEIEIEIYPKPIQKELPVWLTTSGNPASYRRAGVMGANLLTHLLEQDLGALEEGIRVYRKARRASGFNPRNGKVAVMLHTFIGDNENGVLRLVKAPFLDYLKSAVNLERAASYGAGSVSGGHKISCNQLDQDCVDEMLELSFERYYRSASLIGTPEKCRTFLSKISRIGVDEVACLIDFLPDLGSVMRSLDRLAVIKHEMNSEIDNDQIQNILGSFRERMV